MSTPDPTPGWASPDPPLAPWILLEHTTVDQTATALERLEAWLLGGELDAATDCAHTLSRGEDDPTGVARWVGTLAEHLRHRAEEANSWS
jgi:hypothetical protein